jgi:3-hydroxyacyl-CoA dehydrogenase
MNFNEVKTTAVVGTGNIGHGIALTLGLAGY